MGPGWKREKQIIQEAIGGRVKKWKECRKDRRKWVKRWKRKSKNGGYRREQRRKEEKGGEEMCLKSWENLLAKLLSVNESRQVELEGRTLGKHLAENWVEGHKKKNGNIGKVKPGSQKVSQPYLSEITRDNTSKIFFVYVCDMRQAIRLWVCYGPVIHLSIYTSIHSVYKHKYWNTWK